MSYKSNDEIGVTASEYHRLRAIEEAAKAWREYKFRQSQDGRVARYDQSCFAAMVAVFDDCLDGKKPDEV